MACAVHADDTVPAALLPADSASVFRLGGTAGGSAKMSTVAATGQPFKSALRIEVAKKPERLQDVQIAAPVDAAMASGDVLLASFWIRSAAPGEATLDMGFRGPPGGGRGGGPVSFPAVAGAGRRSSFHSL
ncbi:MAG: hypothetical protein P4L56_26890 [Candidatus Sulfopaludibacter sp.]|nr:hypothetical protein [Candidatus Sulfopaludibacter sp.]